MQILPNVTQGLGLGLETCGHLGLGLGLKGLCLVCDGLTNSSVSESRVLELV